MTPYAAWNAELSGTRLENGRWVRAKGRGHQVLQRLFAPSSPVIPESVQRKTGTHPREERA